MNYPFKKIEKKWRGNWLKSGVYEPDLSAAKKPFYNLMMFPYPSAEGLHIGNVYAFVGTDIYGRFMRMQGYDVFEPIGLDGFGIHSENYALKIKAHPARLAKKTEKNFYRQLREIGNGFSWRSKLETYAPDYYKWTQWIFTQMFNAGLAVRKKAEVNWCPKCKTVLADEQVIQKSKIKNQKSKLQLKIQNGQNLQMNEERIGACERCETPVIKKELEQWFFKITDYAERLLRDLEKLDWSEKVKIAQRNWIGKSEGAVLKFQITEHKFQTNSKSQNTNSEKAVEVFTTRPDTVFGATFLVLNPQHPAIKNLKFKIKNWDEVEKYVKNLPTPNFQPSTFKTGVELAGIKAINPATNEEIPVWIANYVLAGYGEGAIMGVPAHDQRDFEFAQKYGLQVKMVVCPKYPEPVCPVLDAAFEGEGHLVASQDFDGMSSEKARGEIIKWLAKKNSAKKETHFHLRDWLISRQRYWGPPIPLVFCENCAVKIKNQKSKIKIKEYNKGEILNPGWVAVPEKDLPIRLPFVKNFQPKGKGVSPLASVKSFYNVKCPKCGGPAKRETDVSDSFLDSSWYFFRYIDYENKKEPFGKIRVKKWLPVDAYIGGAEHAVLHLLYTRFITKVFYDWGLINFQEPFKKFRAHGLIIKDGAKMSKSKGNIVAPDKYINLFGTDTLRTYLLFLGPFEDGGDFRDEGIRGPARFLERAWKLINPKSQIKNYKQRLNRKTQNGKLEKVLHQSIKKITEDIENLRYNTAISQLMILLNAFENESSAPTAKDYGIFLKLFAPFAPHLAEELWHELGNKTSIHKEKWPSYDPKKIKEEIITIPVQINGKVRSVLAAALGISGKEAKEKALDNPRIKDFLSSKKIKKFIYIPGKIISIVLED